MILAVSFAIKVEKVVETFCVPVGTPDPTDCHRQVRGPGGHLNKKQEKEITMKKTALVLILLVLISVVVFAETDKKPLPSDRLVAHLSHCLARQKQEMTAEQEEALRLVHPLLLVAAKHHYYRKYLWEAVDTTEEKEIEWEEAKSMILKGLVVNVGQTHSRNVQLVGTDGRRYRSIEPRIDDVLYLAREVDPKGLFIDYETE
jgi:hypothetical protein